MNRANIAILGSGVVGYATGVGLESLGHRVTFVDIDEARLAELRRDGHATRAADAMGLHGVDAVFVAVPTPAADDGIDTSYLDRACRRLSQLLEEPGRDTVPLLVFRSTMPPGTTRQRLIPALEAGSGKRAGVDFMVCYNPEYLREATSVEDFLNARLLTVGSDQPGDAASRAVCDLFAGAGDISTVELTYEAAEFQKYVHNVFNSTKISFFNEMRRAASVLGLTDTDAVFALTTKTAEAAWNPEYGTRDRGPYGGACLPKDTAAWTAFAQRNGIEVELVKAVHSVNQSLGGAPC